MFYSLCVSFLYFPGLLMFPGTHSRSCIKTTSLPVYLMSAFTKSLNSLRKNSRSSKMSLGMRAGIRESDDTEPGLYSKRDSSRIRRRQRVS